MIVDSLENPQTITRYDTLEAYASAGAQVKILSYTVEPMGRGGFPSWDDGFNWTDPDNGNAHYFNSASIAYEPASMFLAENVDKVIALKDIPNYQLSSIGFTIIRDSHQLKYSRTPDFFPAINTGNNFIAQPSLRSLEILQRTKIYEKGTAFIKRGKPVADHKRNEKFKRHTFEKIRRDKLLYKGHLLKLNSHKRQDVRQWVVKERPLFYDPQTLQIYQFSIKPFTFYYNP